MDPPPNPDIRILIADDSAIVREGLAAILKRQTDMVICAEACDGQEAVKMFRLHAPDVTLMDLRMPQMDGVAAIKSIRAEFASACILVFTTFDGDEAIAQALAAGAATYLLKDASRADLLGTIRTLGQRQRVA